MKEVMLKEDERIDTLEIDNRIIIQNSELYTFTSDAVVLANSVKVTAHDNILDIGSGSGVIPLIIASKNKVGHIDGVEIQNCMADMASRSVEANELEDVISIKNVDVKEYRPGITYDVIISNPPYFKAGDKREREEVAMSRHEVTLSLEELIDSVKRLLKFGGKFYMVHKCSRLAEVMTLMSNAGITPKVLTLIYPKESIVADTFIIEGKSHAKHGLIMRKFVMYNEDGSMTKEARHMYNKEMK